MLQYKTVAGPVRLTISKNENYQEAVGMYADIINREAAAGWQLVMIQEVPVTKQLGGCLAALGIGAATETITFNMLVFVRRVG